MTIALLGNNDGPLRLLRALRGSGHSLVFLGLQKGAGARVQREYEEVRRTHALPVEVVPTEAAARSRLQDYTFDLLINCFTNYRFRELHHRYPTVNVHLAPLPRYRGRHPLRWALINGESEYGASIHRMTDDFDAGEILWRELFPLPAGWSAVQLRNHCLDRVARSFSNFLDDYERGRLVPLPNSSAEASYVTARSPRDSLLASEWSNRDAVIRKVLALRDDEHPAFVRYRGEEVAVIGAHPGERRFVGFVGGTIVGIRREEHLIEVVAADGLTTWLRTRDRARFILNERLVIHP